MSIVYKSVVGWYRCFLYACPATSDTDGILVVGHYGLCPHMMQNRTYIYYYNGSIRGKEMKYERMVYELCCLSHLYGSSSLHVSRFTKACKIIYIF